MTDKHKQRAKKIVMEALRKAGDIDDPEFDDKASNEERCLAYIERGIALALSEAVAEERERCAKVAISFYAMSGIAAEIAAKIREGV